MRVLLHADDIGITESATRDVLSAWRAGALDGFSVIVNGDAVDGLRDELARSGATPARIAVHFNLTEGPCSADPAALGLLVDRDGRFRHSFGGLLRLAMSASRTRRGRFGEQVRTECAAQIRAARRICGNRPVTAIDGHNHVHVIPGVFRAVASAATAEGLSEIRLPVEPFHVADPLRDPVRPFVWVNLLKHIVLRVFSRLARNAAGAAALRSPDRMIGILYTGRMTRDRALRGIAAAAAGNAEVVEVVFHVGRAEAGEAGRWRGDRAYAAFHLTERRDAERGELLRLAERLGRV